MLVRVLPWTWGMDPQSAVVAISPQWVRPVNVRAVRVFPPRVRWWWIGFGHTESDDPAQDTRGD